MYQCLPVWKRSKKMKKSAAAFLTAVLCLVLYTVPALAAQEDAAPAGSVTVRELARDKTVEVTGYVVDQSRQDLQAGNLAWQRGQGAPGGMAWSGEDLEILAHVICGEAQNCDDQEQLYVGSVVLNRVNHSAYPGTIRGVVFQKGQYACTRDGNYYRTPTEANYRNAQWLLENGSVLPGNVVYQSSHRQGKGVYLQTKHHKYCYR
ncbi:MAG: cell wall hydrolase [Lachnospiraceae bacterium]|jgi:spore germination cell wall hydrolase CwlJ-like protein|nr:cell wall hydrolase [Lachnospiraceae bacterium]